MTATKRREPPLPDPPRKGELCDQCPVRDYRQASWAFTVMGHHPRTTARTILCDEHAMFYRNLGPAIYPAAERYESGEPTVGET